MKDPIAVFDSGLGGLTVVAELRRQLPKECFVYFGDTARVPYGCKSPQTVKTFAMQAVEFLLQFDPKIIVAACNTASSIALETLQDVLDIPVIGVIEPGAQAALKAAGEKCMAVIGTEATIGSRAYHRAIWRIAPQARIVAKACPLLVGMVEEGRAPGDPLVQMVLQEYLGPLKEHDPGVLLLGCTHYPLLREAFAQVMGPKVTIIDSAYHTAEQVAELAPKTTEDSKHSQSPTVHCYVTDNPERFAFLGAKFLQQALGQVSYVPLDALIGDPGGALGVMASGKAATDLDVIAEIGPPGDRGESGGVG